MTFERTYLPVYIEGRENPFTAEIDLEPLALRVLGGASVRDVAMDAASDLAKTYSRDGSEKAWAKKRATVDLVKACGGDFKIGWTMYLQGMTEAFARELEPEILEEADTILDEQAELDDAPVDGDDAEAE